MQLANRVSLQSAVLQTSLWNTYSAASDSEMKIKEHPFCGVNRDHELPTHSLSNHTMRHFTSNVSCVYTNGILTAQWKPSIAFSHCGKSARPSQRELCTGSLFITAWQWSLISSRGYNREASFPLCVGLSVSLEFMWVCVLPLPPHNERHNFPLPKKEGKKNHICRTDYIQWDITWKIPSTKCLFYTQRAHFSSQLNWF